MCDFFDDFDDFEGEFMDDDHLEDSFEEDLDVDEQFANDSEFEDEQDLAESQNEEFTASDGFIVGGAMGYAYHEGRCERKRKKRKKFSDDSV